MLCSMFVVRLVLYFPSQLKKIDLFFYSVLEIFFDLLWSSTVLRLMQKFMYTTLIIENVVSVLIIVFLDMNFVHFLYLSSINNDCYIIQFWTIVRITLILSLFIDWKILITGTNDLHFLQLISFVMNLLNIC